MLTCWQFLQRLSIFEQYIYSVIREFLYSYSEDTVWVYEDGTTGVSTIEVEETDTEIIVIAEIPNIEIENLDVQVSQETVLIIGQELKLAEIFSSFDFEFCPNQFQIIIPLPNLIQPHATIAEFNDGILKLTFQKSYHKRRPIKVKIFDTKESAPEQSLAVDAALGMNWDKLSLVFSPSEQYVGTTNDGRTSQ
ncbi:Hsp20/alpha crystallin family protein [Chlorogloeopsis sp. ULAP01]|uniref:Hsp20/alpha crystallin family protein n=1 Tax=Chlorogloeopsis sp. ULAP01 TaxID=3056483 RepID=UPI0025AAFA3E|nr:Hsp20/alpha crystallin family protein [Chlorogloeopsis sp. ULAP01]MDM9381249.1 Hsp20/alpha crystallin family protein [Chlorogloeopsis sp. ULAP01]